MITKFLLLCVFGLHSVIASSSRKEYFGILKSTSTNANFVDMASAPSREECFDKFKALQNVAAIGFNGTVCKVFIQVDSFVDSEGSTMFVFYGNDPPECPFNRPNTPFNRTESPSSTTPPLGPARCDSGVWHLLASKWLCYSVTTSVKFEEGVTRCGLAGATIAVPKSKEENEFVAAKFANSHFFGVTNVDGVYLDFYTKKSPVFANWDEEQPNENNEYACSVSPPDGRWTTCPANELRAVVCQKEAIPE